MAYPTAANLKTWLGTSSSADDTQLGYALDGAIARFERETGRVFVAAALTKSYPPNLPYVGKNRKELRLFDDLQTLVSLTNADGNVISTSDVYLDSFDRAAPYDRIVIDRDRGEWFHHGGTDGNIAVEGTWGITVTCPDDVFLAVLELAALSYRARQSGASGEAFSRGGSGMLLTPSTLPKTITDVIDYYRRR